jgi:hypothetical protein
VRVRCWWILAAVAGGCAGSTEEFQPALSFLSPADGATVPAGELQVSIVVEEFELVPPSVAAADPARGGPALPLLLLPASARAHDEEGVPSGYCDLRLDGVSVASLDSTQLTLTVEAGAHTLEGELRFADGDPLDPPVAASVAFTAE